MPIDDQFSRLDAELALARRRIAELEAEIARWRAAREEIDAAADRALNSVREQNAELRALLTEALRRHDATPLGEWARAARALIADEPHAAPAT